MQLLERVPFDFEYQNSPYDNINLIYVSIPHVDNLIRDKV